MGEFTAGQVVVLPSPFSNLLQNKYRPALLLAKVGIYNESVLLERGNYLQHMKVYFPVLQGN